MEMLSLVLKKLPIELLLIKDIRNLHCGKFLFKCFNLKVKIIGKGSNAGKPSINRKFRNIICSSFRAISVIEKRVNQFIKNVRGKKAKARKFTEKGDFFMEKLPIRTNNKGLCMRDLRPAIL